MIHWLSLVVWMPLVGAAVVVALPAARPALIRLVASGWAALSFAVSGSLVVLLAVLKLYACTTDAETVSRVASVEATATRLVGESRSAQAAVGEAVASVRAGAGTFDLVVIHAVGAERADSGAPLVPLG